MISNSPVMQIIDIMPNSIIVRDQASGQHTIDPRLCADEKIIVGDYWLMDEYGTKKYKFGTKIEMNSISTTKYSMFVRCEDIVHTGLQFVEDMVATGIDEVILCVGEDNVCYWNSDIANDYGLTTVPLVESIITALITKNINVSFVLSFRLFSGNARYCQETQETLSAYMSTIRTVLPVRRLINELHTLFAGKHAYLGLCDAKYDGDNSEIFLNDINASGLDLRNYIAQQIPSFCDAVGATLCIYDDQMMVGHVDRVAEFGIGNTATTLNTVTTSAIFKAQHPDVFEALGSFMFKTELINTLNSSSKLIGIGVTDFDIIPALSRHSINNIFLSDYSKYQRMSMVDKLALRDTLATNRITMRDTNRTVGVYIDTVNNSGLDLQIIENILIRGVYRNNMNVKIFAGVLPQPGEVQTLLLFDAKTLTEEQIDTIKQLVQTDLLNVVITGKIGYNYMVSNNTGMPMAGLFECLWVDNSDITGEISWFVGDTDYGTYTMSCQNIVGSNISKEVAGTISGPIFKIKNSIMINAEIINEQLEELVADCMLGKV